MTISFAVRDRSFTHASDKGILLMEMLVWNLDSWSMTTSQIARPTFNPNHKISHSTQTVRSPVVSLLQRLLDGSPLPRVGGSLS